MINSYIPLYRKYRPQSFRDLVGQEAVVKTLSNAIQLSKVAHAYLFTGTRGTGKTSAARIFAKSLNCQAGPTVDPCGKCPSCLDITSGNAIDVIEIDAASNRKVEDARNLLEKVQFVPVAGKYKIYIIDEVHMLTTEAFNTLLKTLEEPPQNLVFILATTEAHKVLNTIISRCQRFDFRRIRQDLIVERLKEIIIIENLNINENALSLIARRSGGGMRDALSLLDQVSILASAEKEIADTDILSLLGCLQEDTLLKITNAITDKNTANLINTLDEVIQLGSEPVQIIRELMNHFRNLLLIKTTENLSEITSLISVSEQFYGELRQQSKGFEVIEITQIIEKLSNYEKTLKASSQQHLWLEVALIGICNRHDIQVIKDLEARITKLEEIIISDKNIPVISQNISPVIIKPENTPKLLKIPESVQSDGIIDSNTNNIKESPINIKSAIEDSSNILQNWKTLLENIESLPARMFFTNLAKPVEVNSKNIVITFNNDSFAKQALDKSKMIHLESAAQKIFGIIPKIVSRTPLPGDKEFIDEKPVKTKIEPSAKKENFEQISQDLEDLPKTVSKPRVVISEEPVQPMDEEVEEQINELKNKRVAPIDLPESAKIALDLFQGKIIE